jgi:hypothetical protein
MTPPPSNDVPANRDGPDAAPAAGGSPGLPWLRTWRAVYLAVLGSFVLWVVLLAAFARLFA